jgi:digeranylgeranylglycerophospholipid reductase
MEYDVIVVGGSFSGLSSAYHLSKSGLRVCVVDKGKIASHTKSTGILEQSIRNDIKIPSEFIENKIKGMSIYTPALKNFSFPFKKAKLQQSRTLEILKWFKSLCEENDVSFIENKQCKNIKINDNGVKCEEMKSKVIVFATGFLPKLSFLPKNNFEYYAGLEYLANWKDIVDKSIWQIYFDLQIAPGYFFWVAPIDENSAHIGILKEMRDKVPTVTAINNFFSKLNLKPTKIYETRAGAVPIRGSIEKTYGNRFLIVGDAAGHLGQFFSGGIHYGIRAGRIIGEILPDLIDKPNMRNLKLYEDTWKQDFGSVLNEERFIKSLFDKVKTNEQLGELLDVLDSIDKKVVDEIFYRFSSMQQIHLSKLLLPYSGKIFNIVKTFI